jgi:ubiquinone/menaquinone biosynthesis C-methylase UbiE
MSKLSYADIVKIKLDNVITIKKIPNKKYNISTRINILLNKLLKNENNSTLIKIKNIIINSDDIIYSILDINNILNKNKNKNKIYTTNKNHLWISNKLVELLSKFNYQSNIKIADIGGGEGNLINFISKSYNIPSSNLYVIEQQNDWAEKYKYSNNINYLFWNNIDINIKSESIDIILIMVSLHHMLDCTIDNLMLNISRILKKDGLIIIKEHNCTNNEDKIIINWEHHLYHILMSDNLDEENIKNYLNNFINNYKSMEEYNQIFLKYNFKNILNLNRSFTKYINNEYSNSTNLYWALYKKL